MLGSADVFVRFAGGGSGGDSVRSMVSVWPYVDGREVRAMPRDTAWRKEEEAVGFREIMLKCGVVIDINPC